MSHAAPSCAGFAPRHSTFGVATQKFGMGEPTPLGHPVEATGIDEDGKPARSANKKENAELRVLERAMSVHDPSGRKTSSESRATGTSIRSQPESAARPWAAQSTEAITQGQCKQRRTSPRRGCD